MDRIYSPRSLLVLAAFTAISAATVVGTSYSTRRVTFSAPLAATSSSTSLTLSPTADSYVNAVYPTSNYGTASTLQVDGNPIKIIYMKFDLSSLSGKTIASAKLRFYVTNTSSSTQNVKRVSSTSWTETGLTYSSRPTLGTLVSSFVGGPSGVWKEVDITSAVKEKLGTLLSLAVDSTGSDGLDFSSKNSSSNRPQLLITYSSSTSNISPASCTHSLCSGLQGYWNMNETYASSPINRANSISGGSPFQDGLSTGGHVTNTSPDGKKEFINNASYLDYNYSAYPYKSPFLEIPGSSSQPQRETTSGAFTVAGWIRLFDAAHGHPRYVFIKTLNTGGSEYAIQALTPDNGFTYYLAFALGPKSISLPSFPLSNRQWYFFAARYDGSMLRLRVNNTEATAVAATSPTVGTGKIIIGGYQNFETGLGGHVDEIGFWNKALDNSSLTQLYNSGSGLTYPFDGTVLPTPTSIPTRTPTPTPPVSLTWGWYDTNGQPCTSSYVSNDYRYHFSPSSTCEGTPIGYTQIGTSVACKSDGTGYCRKLTGTASTKTYASFTPGNVTQCTAQTGSTTMYPTLSSCSYMALSAPGCTTLSGSPLSFTANDVQFAVHNTSSTSPVTSQEFTHSWVGTNPDMRVNSVKAGSTYIVNSVSYTTPYTINFSSLTPPGPTLGPSQSRSLVPVFNYASSGSGKNTIRYKTTDASGKQCTAETFVYRGPTPTP